LSGRDRLLLALAAIVAVALVVSGIAPTDRITWVMEVMPVVIAGAVIAATWTRFPLTTLLCILIAAHSVVLIVGGAYTYAHVPFGFWLQDLLGTARNPYDKIGHFMQGFVPAMAAREIFVRGGYVTGRRMTAFLCICVALAVSAVYELIEWWAALAMGQGADEFLGTQGDQWDTQSDMFMALIGSCTAMALLSRLHDRQIAALSSRDTPRSASTA
jgi:putative membrane protein